MRLVRNPLRILLALGLFSAVTHSFAHVVLAEPATLANTSYRAMLRVGHGCAGAPTTAIRFTMPANFRGAKPMPKAGWVVSVKWANLDKPYDQYGKQVTEDVSEISWTAASKDNWLPDNFYDEFVLRGLPAQAGPMWFKVLQTCTAGSADWAQVPASGIATYSLKTSAALLVVIPSEQVGGHQH